MSAHADTTAPRAWAREDVAAYFSIDESTLARLMAAHPDFPAPVALLPGVERWWPDSVRAWFAQRAGAAIGAPAGATAEIPVALTRRVVVPKPGAPAPGRRRG